MMGTNTAFPSSDVTVSSAELDLDTTVEQSADIRAIRQQALLFRATFEHAAVGIAHVAPDGRWLRANQRLCTILGYTEAELLGKTFQELTYPEDLQADITQVAQMLAGELPSYTMRKRYLHKAGRLVWANLTVSLIRRADGAPDYFVSLVEDITPLMQTEAALRQSEECYRQVVEAQTDIVWRYQLDFTLTFINRSGAALLGQSATALVGQSILPWIPQEYHTVLHTALTALTARQPTTALTIPLLLATGEQQWFHWTCCLIVDEQGQSQEIQAVGRDITLQRKLELQLRYNASLQEQVSDAVIVTDLALQIRSWNRAATAIYGWLAADVIGQPMLDLLQMPISSRLEDHEQWQALLQTGQWQGEVQQQRQDGRWLDIQSSLTLLRDEHELPIGVIAINRDITARKRAEAELQAKIAEEQLFQTYLKTLHEITIELTAIDDMDDFYKQVVELGLRRLGFERLGLLFYDAERHLALGCYGTDAQGHVVAEHHLQFAPTALTGILQRALVSPEHFAFESQTALFSNGEPIGAGWNAVAVLWNGQQGLGWLSIDNGVHQHPPSKPLFDILALYSLTVGTLLGRKQSESALRKSEEKFRLLVEAAPLAIIISDQQGQMTLVNRRAELLFAYPRHRLIGQSIDLLAPLACQAQHAQNRANYIAAPRVRQMGLGQDLFARRSDGHEFPVEIELSYVKTPTGTLVMSFILDISERKRTAAALREQRDFLQLVIDTVPDLITVNDRDGRFRMVNERAAQIYGLTAAEMVGKSDLEVNPHPHEVNYFLDTDQAVFQSGQPLFIPEQTILGRYYQTNKIPLPTKDGLPPESLLVVSSDITKHKEAEVGLQHALAKERELSELKSRFVSMASHEFRTPLTTILGLASLLREYWPRLTPEKINERLTKICDQVGHLEDIINDVLQLTRFQSGRTPFHPAPLDLALLCQTVIEEFRGRPDVKHQLRFYQETPIGEAALDSKLMRQILNNLIENAIKYSTADQAIEIRLAQRDDSLILQVRDAGIGIPAADLTYLFEPFHRAANVEKISGTGLGLTVTKAAVLLHGGTITVDSQIGVGTTFTISLPCAR